MLQPMTVSWLNSLSFSEQPILSKMFHKWLGALYYIPVAINMNETLKFNDEEVCPSTFVHKVYNRWATNDIVHSCIKNGPKLSIVQYWLVPFLGPDSDSAVTLCNFALCSLWSQTQVTVSCWPEAPVFPRPAAATTVFPVCWFTSLLFERLASVCPLSLFTLYLTLTQHRIHYHGR